MAARAHHNHHPVLVSAAASPARSEDIRLRRSPPPAKTEGRRLRRSPPVSVDKERRQGRASRASRGGAVVAGTAAGTAAGCAAVCACFPFAVLEFAVLAAVRAPAAMCRRTVRDRRNQRRVARARRKKEVEGAILGGDASPKSVAAAQAKHAAPEEEEQGWCHWPVKPAAAVVAAAEELAEAEKELWERFYGTAGFWRSPSQREETW